VKAGGVDDLPRIRSSVYDSWLACRQQVYGFGGRPNPFAEDESRRDFVDPSLVFCHLDPVASVHYLDCDRR